MKLLAAKQEFHEGFPIRTGGGGGGGGVEELLLEPSVVLSPAMARYDCHEIRRTLTSAPTLTNDVTTQSCDVMSGAKEQTRKTKSESKVANDYGLEVTENKLNAMYFTEDFDKPIKRSPQRKDQSRRHNHDKGDVF